QGLGHPDDLTLTAGLDLPGRQRLTVQILGPNAIRQAGPGSDSVETIERDEAGEQLILEPGDRDALAVAMSFIDRVQPALEIGDGRRAGGRAGGDHGDQARQQHRADRQPHQGHGEPLPQRPGRSRGTGRHQEGGSSRYPTPRTVVIATASPSFLRTWATWTSTVRASPYQPQPQTPSRICWRDRARPRFSAR